MNPIAFLSLIFSFVLHAYTMSAREVVTMSLPLSTPTSSQVEDSTQSSAITEEMLAVQRLMDSIDAGKDAVRNYFNHSDYSVLYDYLDEPQHADFKKALQEGSYTVIYIPLNAYHAEMSTNHYYFYEGPTDTMEIMYDENGMVEDVVGFTYRGIYEIRSLTK